ncbi:S41 family peptidase [Massilia horti]|uniref:Tail specific protease domain-containing protein n=1 Tax=Massilia horti TaxID=2562153 RepID=A0A4Y9SY60_9BURK|nr:S41 family peptidase [Massilia horti]TFW30299.1 hypothetical protein E4O92_17175 [Massilia horti]
MKKKWLAALLVAPVLAATLALVFTYTRSHGRAGSNTIDIAERRQVIATLNDQISRHYVFADKAQQIASLLREREKDYDRIGDAQTLARVLNDDMASIAHDVNLKVTYSPPGQTPEWLEPLARWFKPGAVAKAELLPPDIGYLEIAEFMPPELAAREYAQALDKLKRTNAIIVDLRRNAGGSREAARLLASYFVDRPLPLNEAHYRDHIERPWTVRRLGARPHLGEMYVLTSGETKAAAEDFAYTMQAMKRASIVGEQTRGGANLADTFRLGPCFVASIPRARLVSPVTHANWEGVGVRPDIPAPSKEALRTIRRRILTDRLAHASNAFGYIELRKMLSEL